MNNYYKSLDIEIPEEKNINEIIEKIQNLHIIKNNIFNSSIIKDDLKKQNLINNWIKEKIDKNIIKYELIYKLTENGSKTEDFHKCCDNKGSTLTIIETKNNDIFGGFTPLNWKKNSDSRKGGNFDYNKKTFLFSMNLLKKYNMFNVDKPAILCYDYYGPSFGNSDILYYGQTLLKGKVHALDD